MQGSGSCLVVCITEFDFSTSHQKNDFFGQNHGSNPVKIDRFHP